MGMTIEEEIKTLIEMYHYIKGDTHFCGYIEEDATNALEAAIETMRKCKKIEQIIKTHDNDRMPEDYWYIDKIREVIEDGKNN